jgi:methyl-accepting chemotaxis protein
VSATSGGIPDPFAFWREEFERMFRAGTEVTDPAGLARQLTGSLQQQAEFQSTALRQQRELLTQLLQPLRSQADFLHDAAEPMRQLSELYRQAAELLERQAGLFEQAAAPIRSQAEVFDRLLGLSDADDGDDGASDR